MKTFKAIISVMLLTVSMSAQAQQGVTVKTSKGINEYLVSNRLVLDFTAQRPVVRNNYLKTTYNKTDTLVMYVSAIDDPDAIKVAKANSMSEGTVYDLSGRKIVNGKLSNGKLPKGIYIQSGKKIARHE